MVLLCDPLAKLLRLVSENAVGIERDTMDMQSTKAQRSMESSFRDMVSKMAGCLLDAVVLSYGCLLPPIADPRNPLHVRSSQLAVCHVEVCARDGSCSSPSLSSIGNALLDTAKIIINPS